MAFLAPLWSGKLGYSAMNDRQVIDSFLSAGVGSPSDLLCVAGTGFTSTIAGGRCAVEGNNVTQQGMYIVQNTGSVVVTHTNPNASNPRIDQIGVKVNDSTDGGDISDGSEPLILAGTPTAGATLADPKGKAILPKNFLVLYYVLVPASAASSSAFTYEDKRQSIFAGSHLLLTGRTNTAFTCAVGERSLAQGSSNAVYKVPPAASPGDVFSVVNFLNSEANTVTIEGSTFSGDFINAETKLVLAQHQHVDLQWNGVVWMIIAGAPRRPGRIEIAGEQATVSTSFVSLGDEAEIVVPDNGLIAVAYQATWKVAGEYAGAAAIFLNNEQIKLGGRYASGNCAALIEQAAMFGSSSGTGFIGVWTPLSTFSGGLVTPALSSGDVTQYTGDVTTGQLVGVSTTPYNSGTYIQSGPAPYASPIGSQIMPGGPAYIFVAAGTYKVSVRYKVSNAASTLSIKQRKLWVWNVI